MGGAGIAIIDRSGRTTGINPAALALLNRRVKAGFPNIGFHASGIPLKAAYEHLIENPDQNDTVSLARDFGGRDSSFSAHLGFGMRFGHLDARAEGIGTVHILPNAALQQWSKTANGDVNLLTGAEQADLLGAAVYSLPTVGVAERVSPAGSPTRVEVGARVKLQRAVYSHYIATSDDIRFNRPAVRAPELGGGSTLTKDGIGVDLGFLIHSSRREGLSGAIVVTNAVEPSFIFHGTDQHGSPARYDLQPRSFSVGSAYATGRMVFAADAVDLSAAYGNVQGRVGAEYASHKWAVRAGYASARGFTFGLGLRYFDVAIGARAPLEISQTLRF
jgi:hypothetical protein